MAEPPVPLTELRRIVGDDAVIADPDALLVYESDGLTTHHAVPRAVVLPQSTEDVARTVQTLTGAGVPFVARGAGTGLSGGAVALEGAVIISLTRMRRVLEVDPVNRRARVEPGVINAELSRVAAPHGLFYAPDPSSQSACTIGGNVAENAGGPHCLKYGVTMNHVHGLTVVLPDGDVVELGGGVGECVGYDLVGLFVGSEGTFGIATEIVVQLEPRPEAVETLLALFNEIDDASHAVSAIIADGMVPAALEMIDHETIRAVEESIFAAGIPTDVAAALVVDVDGPRAGLAAEADRAAAICQEHGARVVQRAADAAERERLWQARKKAFGAMGRLAPDLLVQDAVVPRTELPAVLEAIYRIAERYDLRITNVFHAGDGNLHPNILFDRRDTEEVSRVEAASREIMQRCVEAGGTITGEHGVGLDKREYMGLVIDDVTLQAMRDVRRVFDPHGYANPGKIFPATEEEEETPADRTRRTAQSDAIHDRVAEVVGADRVHTGEAVEPWTVHGQKPRLVAAPPSEAAAAELLALASAEGWSVRLAGAGGCLDSAHAPEPIDLVVTTAALAGVHAYEPEDLVVTVGAGTSLHDLNAALSPHNQWLPLDPPDRGDATIGAVIATGSAGPLREAYGTPRDHVLGLTLVTGDGRIIEAGGRVVKNVAGYDLVRLATGSRGTLGLITRVHLRASPLPADDETLVLSAWEPAPLVDLVARIRGERITVSTLEIVGGAGSDATLVSEILEATGYAGAGAAPWALLVRLQGRPEAISAARTRIEGLATRSLGGVSGVRSLARDRSALRGRSPWSVLASVEARAGLSIRLADLPSRLAETLAVVRTLASDVPGAGILAHAGAGIVRVCTAEPLSLRVTERLAEGVQAFREERATAGASVVVPRGPAVLTDLTSPLPSSNGVVQRLTHGLREVFDPVGVLSTARHESVVAAGGGS